MTKQIPSAPPSPEESERPRWYDFLDVLDQLALDDDEVQDENMKDLLRGLKTQVMEKLYDFDPTGKVPEQFPEFFVDHTPDSEYSLDNFTSLQRAMIQFVAKKGGPSEMADSDFDEYDRAKSTANIRFKATQVLARPPENEFYGLNKIHKIDDIKSPCKALMVIYLDTRTSNPLPAYVSVEMVSKKHELLDHMKGFNYTQKNKLIAFRYLDPVDDKWKWEVMGFHEDEFLDAQDLLSVLYTQSLKQAKELKSEHAIVN